MKTLYLIGGTMGVGKTAACQALKRLLPDSVYLDGDWCWDMHPFQVTQETKTMVMDNICHTLNNFLHCSAFRTVIFGWVLHRQDIWDELTARLDTAGWTVRRVALVCSPEALRARIAGDVAAGRREPEVLPRSLARLLQYAALEVERLDTTHLTPEQTAVTLALGADAAGETARA